MEALLPAAVPVDCPGSARSPGHASKRARSGEDAEGCVQFTAHIQVRRITFLELYVSQMQLAGPMTRQRVR